MSGRPVPSSRVVEKYERVRDERDSVAAEQSLVALEKAASDDGKNLMPYLIECCHVYATVGEMVATLKGQWGEFEEPVRL